MVCQKMTKKPLAVICITALLVLMMAAPVFAAVPPRAFDLVTFDDSSDFTIVKQGLLTVEPNITLVGLNYTTYEKQAFEADEFPYINWVSDSTRVILFDSNDIWNFGYSITGTDSVAAVILGRGTSNITATYAPGVVPPQSVFSYVVAEGITITNSVSNVTLNYEGDATGVFNYPDSGATPPKPSLTVPRFSLQTVFGAGFEDSDVLKNTPSALHALLYGLEIEKSTEGPTTPIADFDWDWVRSNVLITSQGSYVDSIGADVPYTTPEFDYYGWQYRLNGADPGHAASVTPLNNNDVVRWFFGPYSF